VEKAIPGLFPLLPRWKRRGFPQSAGVASSDLVL